MMQNDAERQEGSSSDQRSVKDSDLIQDVSSVTLVNGISSHVQARRILDEIAIQGRYSASRYQNGFVVYKRSVAGGSEELIVNRLGARKYSITRVTTGK